MKKNIKYSIVFLVIFFSGILFERFELDNKTVHVFKNMFNGSYRIIYRIIDKDSKIKIIKYHSKLCKTIKA